MLLIWIRTWGSLSAELFEEKLEEINRDLRKFDAATEFHSKSNSPTGPQVKKIIWTK